MDKYQISINTFNKLAEDYQSKYMDFDFYFDTYERFCELVVQKNAKIFDIGCGPGNIAKYLLARRPDYQIKGIDLAPKMVELARKNNPTASFEVMDSRQISQIDEQLDAVICGFCTPYLAQSDVQNLVKNIRSMVKADGVLYLSTMEDKDSRSGYQTSTSGDQVYIHYHQFDFLSSVLSQNGFEILEIQRKLFPLDTGEPTTDLFIYAKALVT